MPIGDAETGKTSTLRGIGRQIVESKASDEPSTGR
jgi:hypothetical protein